MGVGRTKAKSRANSKKKYAKKYLTATKFYSTGKLGRDVDLCKEDMEKGGKTFEFDPELPGGGKFYCAETGKHFIDAHALKEHRRSKAYKRRIKQLKEEQYTHAEAELGAGISKEEYAPIKRDEDGNIAA